MKKLFFFLSYWLFIVACQSPEPVDLLVYNAVVNTMDSTQAQAEALVVKDGKVWEVGSSQDLQSKYKAAQELDAQGKYVFPGLIDAHCHFFRYGLGLQTADLVGTQSYEEIIQKLIDFREKYPNTPWILGRGWDQNDWENKAFPNKAPLDSLFPDTPVLLSRVDGHGALANQKALDLAGITQDSKDIIGGKFIREDGKLTGVLIDNTIALVSRNIPKPSRQEQITALLEAQANCFAVGLTSVHDAGLDKDIIELIDSLQEAGDLKMHIYAMISNSEANRAHYLKTGPIVKDRLHVCSFKLYADGALGSRGACLIEPYSDDPDNVGFLRASPEELDQWLSEIAASPFQANTHCIGDSANSYILDVYGKYLEGPNDRRWRIEHAQVIHTGDFSKFKEFSIIPSVQPTHATSDMYWAGERLGKEREKGAYAYKDLQDQNPNLALGSDFPVEQIDPLLGFYAGVFRIDSDNYPEGGYQIENALSRYDALKGATLGAAYAAFEEKERGSLRKGKWADFIILDQDIMQASPKQVLNTKVLNTYVHGELVYSQEGTLLSFR